MHLHPKNNECPRPQQHRLGWLLLGCLLLPCTGYTGHVMDGGTGLTYMQQRYYDPTLGRFLSVDPMVSDTHSGWNFNRYNYAADNPYKFKDPDGRIIETPWDVANVAMDVISIGTNLAAGNYVSAAIDVGALAYDGFATAVPGLPAGAGAGLRAYRTAEKATEVYKGSQLARNMAKANNSVSKGVQDAHHVVAQNAKLAAPARAILKKHGIDINDARNGAAMDKSPHKAVHTKQYYQEVNQKIANADKIGGKDAVCASLCDIVKGLQGK